jgi:hypothetical protein
MRKIIATVLATVLIAAGLVGVGSPAQAAFACSTVPQGAEVRVGLFVSAYDWWDNTPRGSAAIAYPGFHSEASGAGTYGNPITVAVGHCIVGGKSIPDYAVGTRWYDPFTQRYFRTEDLCGDGDRPQDGPCHTGQDGRRWIDIWINGRTDTADGRASSDCMDGVTGVRTVIRNPGPSYPVPVSGSIFEHGSAGCR